MMSSATRDKATIVLVHAAWADGSSWNKVIPRLQETGLRVKAVQIPLTSLADDVTTLERVLRGVEGPVLLVGHSYGGAVTTAAGAQNANVRALVYVAAMAPDEGETVGELLHRAPPHAEAPRLAPDADGFLWLPAGAFAKAVAPDSSPDETALMEATQKPISLKCLAEPMSPPAWREKPSWFLIAEKDRMISPATQRMMAERMQARIHSVDADHTPLTSSPSAVVRVILEATDAAVRG